MSNKINNKIINVKDIEQMIEDENISSIFLDIDGVVIDSVRAMCQLLNEKYDTNCKPINITSWNFNEVKPNLTSEEIEDLFNDKRFFDIVKVYNGVGEFINKYRNKIIFLTKGGIENISGKHELFRLNMFNNIPIIGLPLNISKGLINMQYKGKSLFIDDCSQNLIDSNADIKIMMKEYDGCEWQQNWSGYVMKGWE